MNIIFTSFRFSSTTNDDSIEFKNLLMEARQVLRLLKSVRTFSILYKYTNAGILIQKNMSLTIFQDWNQRRSIIDPRLLVPREQHSVFRSLQLAVFPRFSISETVRSRFNCHRTRRATSCRANAPNIDN